MIKKYITKKQKTRIAAKQLSLTTDFEAQKIGLVIARFGKEALIEDEKGKQQRLAIRPQIDSLVAGDRVIWLQENEKHGSVIARLDRQSVLLRENQYGQPKPIAANVSQLMIVVAVTPKISWILLDSYLVAAQYLGLKANIILNKIDLNSEAIEKYLDTIYKSLGYTIIKTSYKDINSYKKLLNRLQNEISIFVGQSGVGKSSIIKNCLINNENIKTGALSQVTNLGKHTTSSTTLFHVDKKADIIDSPGVRQFKLPKVTPRDIANGYIEFQDYLAQCKFRDCNHITTPECSIIKALEDKKISEFRYRNFIKNIQNNIS